MRCMALPLIRDKMLLKQKSKFKFLDQWSLDVRMQHTTNTEKPGTSPGFFIFVPHRWCVVRYFDPGRHSTRGSIMRPEYASRLPAAE